MKSEPVSAALYAMLQPRAGDGEQAVRIVDELVSDLISVLRRQPGCTSTRLDLELLFANLRRDAITRIFNLSHDTLDLHDTVNLIACRFFGEE
jgi:hypothetical protein